QVVEHLMAEVTPTLHPVPGIDLDQYKQTLIERFANPKIRDQLSRLTLNSSAKLPKWVLATLRDKLQQDGAIDYLSLTIASWCRCLQGQDDQGKPIAIEDPLSDLLTQQARSSETDPSSLLSLAELFGDLPQSAHFVETVTQHLRHLSELGTKTALAQLLPTGG
ncbi:MAG TPA: mannitol dehydrogenase family protein, partial [Microcoleaceae cyanobacterium]